MAEDTQNAAYENALRQLDELIVYLRSSREVSCAVAEQEDLMLIRLADLKIDLRPSDEKAIADNRPVLPPPFGGASKNSFRFWEIKNKNGPPWRAVYFRD